MPVSIINTDITTLSASAFAALTISEIKSLSSVQCSAIIPSQLSNLPAEKIAALPLKFLSSATLTGISTSAINGLTIKNLSSEQIQALTTEQMSALSAKKFANFSPEQLAYLTTAQIAAVNFSDLDSEQIGTLTSSQLGALNSSYFSSLPTEALAGLNSTNIAGLNTTQINTIASALNPSQLNAFSTLANLDSQTVAAISPEILKAINVNALNVSYLTPQQISQLTPETLANFTVAQIANFTPEQSAFLKPAQIAALSAAQTSAFPITAIASLKPQVIKSLNLNAFNSADIGALTTKQVAYLTAANILQISTANASGLTIEQINAMKVTSLQGLSTAVRDTLGTNVYYAYQAKANNPPMISNLNAAETYTEDTPLNFVNDIVVSSTSSPNITVTLTLSNMNAGSFNTASSNNVTTTFNSGVWTASGAIADVNTLLAGLIFTPASNFNSNFTVTANVLDGLSPAITGVKNFTGTAVNDAPIATNSTVTTNENTIKTFIASDFSFTDTENNALSAIIITSLPAAGMLKLNNVAVTANQEISVADISNLTFTPVANASGTNYANFGFKVKDDGGTANGGVDTSTSVATMTVNVAAVNDVPILVGGNGKVTTNLDAGWDTASSVALQSDNKLVVAGWTYNPADTHADFALVRYDANGNLDNSFGTNGKVKTVVSGGNNHIQDVKMQTDGKILVAGSANTGTVDFALARYNSDGTLDTSFSSDGIVTTGLNNGGNGVDSISAIALQSDGKIVAAGSTNTASNNYDFSIARYNTDGSLDNSFGSNGVTITAFNANIDGANALAIQSDGKIVLAGTTSNGTNNDIGIARYNSDGTLDTTFGTGGKIIESLSSGNDSGNGIAIQSDGKILVSGTTYNSTSTATDFALLRYNASGTLDTSFGINHDGKVTTPISGYANGRNVVVQPDGKILVSGSNRSGTWDFVVARYTSDGLLDTSFGTNGYTLANVGVRWDTAYNMLLQPDGKIVVVGENVVTNGSDNQFATIRYNSDGSLDTSFNVSLVAGTPTQGQTLSIATNSITDADGLGTFSYQWKKTDGSIIATTPTLLLTQNEVGQTITATVSYTDGAGTPENLTSSPTSAVVNINDAPVAINSTVTTNEDTPKIFSASDFSFTDIENNALSAIIITSLPATGTLKLNNVAVTANQEISVADISSLTFTPAANADGNNYASFDFEVKDNGGVTNGGVDISTNSATFTINVIAANNFSVSAALSETDMNNSYRNGSYVDIYPLTGFSNGDLVTISLNAGFDTYLQIVRNDSLVEYNDDVSNDNFNSQITYTYQTGDLIYATSYDNGATGQYTLTANKQFIPPTTPQIYNNHTYILSNSTTWQQAQAQAVVLGGNLVTINNATENAWLVATFGGMEEYWMGLTDEEIENTFIWINTEDASYRNWATSPIQQPDNSDNQDYGVINWGGNAGAWDDQGVNISHRGIIEIPHLNVAPTATNVDISESYTEDTPLNLTDIVITDTDSANITVTLALSNVAAGNFNVATSNSVTSTYDSQTGIWRASGTIADINILLAGLTFTPTVNFNSNFTVAVNISDGIAPAIMGSKNFTGTAVNDAPTIAALPPSNALQNPATGNYYSLSTSTTWQNAENQAIELGGHLVTINDAQEKDWLVQTYGNNELFWIGFTDQQVENTFVWSSGEPVTYTNWNTDLYGNIEPNNSGNEDYTVINWDNRTNNIGKWNDLSGVQSYQGIIEISGTRKITLLEDTTRNFQLNNFGSDVDGNLDSVTITSLPEKGFLKLNGETVTTGQVIPVNSISTLTFTPEANENGANYTTIPYILTDSADETINGSLAIDVIAVNDAPTGSVTILGTPQVGQTLTASNDLADADDLGTISYQWKADNIVIDSALSSTYVLVAGDVNKTITVTVSYTDGGGTVEAVTSEATIQIVGSA